MEARLWLSEATEPALPEKAVLRVGERFYAFIASEQAGAKAMKSLALVTLTNYF